jgi:hypothetical protein
VWLLTGVTRTQAIAGAVGLASGLVIHLAGRWLWRAR